MHIPGIGPYVLANPTAQLGNVRSNGTHARTDPVLFIALVFLFSPSLFSVYAYRPASLHLTSIASRMNVYLKIVSLLPLVSQGRQISLFFPFSFLALCVFFFSFVLPLSLNSCTDMLLQAASESPLRPGLNRGAAKMALALVSPALALSLSPMVLVSSPPAPMSTPLQARLDATLASGSQLPEPSGQCSQRQSDQRLQISSGLTCQSPMASPRSPGSSAQPLLPAAPSYSLVAGGLPPLAVDATSAVEATPRRLSARFLDAALGSPRCTPNSV